MSLVFKILFFCGVKALDYTMGGSCVLSLWGHLWLHVVRDPDGDYHFRVASPDGTSWRRWADRHDRCIRAAWAARQGTARLLRQVGWMEEAIQDGFEKAREGTWSNHEATCYKVEMSEWIDAAQTEVRARDLAVQLAQN